MAYLKPKTLNNPKSILKKPGTAALLFGLSVLRVQNLTFIPDDRFMTVKC